MSAAKRDRLYLTGFMGSGKSTIAPPLARLLGFRWIDTDAEVEKRRGLNVAEIFARDGEAAFRLLEREALAAASAMTSVVVATGGGAIANDEGCELALATGTVVYLRYDAATLARRLESMDGRPVLAAAAGSGTVLLREAVGRLLAERERYYLRADVIVTPGPADPGAAARAIADALPPWFPRAS